jgi:hypothetical protein
LKHEEIMGKNKSDDDTFKAFINAERDAIKEYVFKRCQNKDCKTRQEAELEWVQKYAKKFNDDFYKNIKKKSS